MNQRFCAEMAALIAVSSHQLLEEKVEVPALALQQYVISSRKRFERWRGILQECEIRLTIGSPELRALILEKLEPKLGQIFCTELVTRLWGAVLTGIAQRQQCEIYEAIARRVLIEQLEVRRLALQILSVQQDGLQEQWTRIDRTRLRVERWTDLLLGHLIDSIHCDEFAFDLDRCRDFSSQSLWDAVQEGPDEAGSLLLCGLRLAFPKTEDDDAGWDEDLRQVFLSILACFPAEALPADGLFSAILDDWYSSLRSLADTPVRTAARSAGPEAGQMVWCRPARRISTRRGQPPRLGH